MYMKITLPVLIGTCAFFSAITASAQQNEFSLYAGAGMHGLQYDNTHGGMSIKPGFQAGVGYTRLLSSRWGIRTGLEIGYYHTRATLNAGTAFISQYVDSEGEGFEYRVKASGYREDQKLYTVNIPLLLQFQTPGQGKQQFYALGGAKLGIPFSQTYTSHADEISASGYYPNLDLEITDLPVHGFGKQAGWSGKGDNDLKIAISLAAEAGLRFRVSANSYLYTGAYIDYGLNKMKKAAGNSPLLTYDPNGLAQSKATGIFALPATTEDVKLIAYGIKLGFAFGSNRKSAKPAPITPPVLPAAPVTTVVVDKQPTQPAEPVKPDTLKAVPAVKTIPAAQPIDTLTAAELQVLGTAVAFSQKGDTLLSPAAQQQVDKVIAILQAHSALALEIQGHTCDVGTDAVNERIGLARAKIIAAYIESKGIATSRIQPVSKADREPLVPNTSETNRKQNRRVLFTIIVD
jgi:OOP family OmpA-OmpF porin